MENEIWKDIPGFEGVYQASNKGRIKSVSRIDLGGRVWKERLLSIITDKLGYKRVGLHHGDYHKNRPVHRLVAMAFIPNPNNYPQINHKDENPGNNNVENLEWCDYLYNRNYGHRNEKAARSQSLRLKGWMPHPEYMKAVQKIDLHTGDVIACYVSASEAARQCGLRESKISLVCNGKRHTTGGYKWRYKTDG